MSQRFGVIRRCNCCKVLLLESSDGNYSDSVSDEVNNVIANIKNEEDSYDSDDEYTHQEKPTNIDDDARAESSNDNDEQILLGKDGPHWQCSVPSQVTAGELQQHNIVIICAGPTSYSTSRIIRPLSLFHIQSAHAEEYSEVHYCRDTLCH